MEPLLVVERGPRIFAFIVALAVVGLALGLPLLGIVGYFAIANALVGHWPHELSVLLGVLGPMVVLSALAYHWADVRTGRAEFFHDRVQICTVPGRHPRSVLRWDEASGYEDGAAGMVRVCRRSRTARTLLDDVRIPTRSDAERTRVLAFLDARGLTRLES